MRLNSGGAARRGLIPVAWVMTAGLAVALGGCESSPLSGAKLYAVKGKVLLPDGKPLGSGRVVFVGKESMASASAGIQSDGSFEFKTPTGEGLPEGEYKVHLEIDESRTAAPKGRLSKAKVAFPFPQKYADEDTSDLTAVVSSDASKNHFELKLSNSPSAKEKDKADFRR
jgi:hypothetical protein